MTTRPTAAATDSAIVARVRRWLPDVLGPLEALYGSDAANVAAALEAVAAATARARTGELADADEARLLDPEWFQSPAHVGYVAYVEQFGPTLRDVASRVDYLRELGVTYLHLMKVIRARPEPSDGGFAVADYRDVDPELGTVEDLRTVCAVLRSHGISVCLDFVMNHTAREHEWAMKAMGGDPHFRDYYLCFEDRTLPDRYEETLPEVFPELAPGNFTWEEDLRAYVWTTFNTYQWDLNYRNPNVLVEMFENLCFLANTGVDVMRLDAVAFTWKRLGTDCQNQPEAHLIVQVLRAFMAVAAPAVLLKAEAIVGPRDLTAYLGAHRLERRECQLAYHNQLMVLIWSALATREASMISTAMANLPPTPFDAAWATYVRCHDDIGWAIDDHDAAAAGVTGAGHRAFLSSFYRGDFPGTFGHGVPFSSNPLTGDERTCGMTADLCGLADARSVGDAAAVELGIRRFLLAYALAASFGMPLLYMGDELALEGDLSYQSDPARADDSRWIHRPAMNWSLAAQRAEAGTVEHRIFSELVRLLSVRASLGGMWQGGSVRILPASDHRVFAAVRDHRRHGAVVIVANFAEHEVSVDGALVANAGLSGPVSDATPALWRDGRLQLAPLSVRWLVEADASTVVPVPGRRS
jgi:amylosucrase